MVHDLIATLQQLPELARHFREKSEEVFRTGKRLVCEDGREYLDQKFTISPVLSPEGKVTRLMVTIADISLQNQMVGIAHDFNNMLTIILGHAEMAMEESDPSSITYADFDAIHQAATRSAGLTQQLLAFARKQIVTGNGGATAPFFCTP